MGFKVENVRERHEIGGGDRERRGRKEKRGRE